MRFDPDTHRRRSTRLAGHDYSRRGAYFVTVCTRERICWFGEVDGGSVSLSDEGRAVQEVLLSLPRRLPGVRLDAFVVMPNHVHAIVRFSSVSSDVRRPSGLGEIVRTFKAASTSLIRSGGETGFAWQRNYHDRVIRDDAELRRIRAYIADNPRNWPADPEHPSIVAAAASPPPDAPPYD